MRKTILSLFTLGVVSVLALTAVSAFFNDTETSTGNLLQAGALDLKIDNTCYYNGQACINGNWGGGTEPNEVCDCTWTSTDLSEEVFFNLTDLKPGDWEEDTISVEVDNPSWLCADIDVTRHADNTCTEPEQEDELGACVEPGENLGDLAQELYFVFWRDDGDNVFETNEVNNVLTRGTADAVLGDVSWALADSTTPGALPIPAEETVYIGKFFCFGSVIDSPVAPGANSPTVDSGFDCDGSLVDNKAQTDVLMGDISFYAEQHRHNPGFRCDVPRTPPTLGTGTPTLTPVPTLVEEE